MNPVRPEGRAAVIRKSDDEAFMRDMAVAYLRAAKLIAAHNDRNLQAPFFEDNMADLMEFLDSL